MLRPDSDRPCCRCKVGTCDNCVCGAAGKTCISCISTNCQNTEVNIFVIYKISAQSIISSDQLIISSAQLIISSAQLIISLAQLIVSSAQLIVSSAQLIVSSAQLLAHQWGAYAITVALMSVVRRVSSVSTITTRNN